MCSIPPTPADSAYRSVEIEARLKEKGLHSRIHRRAARNRQLSERQKSANTTRSKVRARVELVFGHQQSSMGGMIVRTIGIARARFQIGMMNLGYNIPSKGSGARDVGIHGKQFRKIAADKHVAVEKQKRTVQRHAQVSFDEPVAVGTDAGRSVQNDQGVHFVQQRIASALHRGH
jgi:hypothetical protein